LYRQGSIQRTDGLTGQLESDTAGRLSVTEHCNRRCAHSVIRPVQTLKPASDPLLLPNTIHTLSVDRDEEFGLQSKKKKGTEKACDAAHRFSRRPLHA
jgi:hypothetical protein